MACLISLLPFIWRRLGVFPGPLSDKAPPQQSMKSSMSMGKHMASDREVLTC